MQGYEYVSIYKKVQDSANNGQFFHKYIYSDIFVVYKLI